MKCFFYTCFFVASFSLMMLQTKAQTVIPLYPGTVPNSIDDNAYQEIKSGSANNIGYGKVTKPTLEIYLPEKEKASGAAVVICPGGGYAFVSYDHEGTEIAKAFNQLGVAAFVLKYRLPSDAIMKDKSLGPLQDAQMAIKTVREGATKWNVDPHKVGIIGFSAGGSLAALTGSHYNDAKIANTNNTSLRPDFMVLLYPVISMTDSLTHKGSHDNLLGSTPTPEQVRYFSNELNVTPNTPPTMLVHAEDDNVVNVKNSLYYYQALLKNKVPAELIIYPKGGHGFGLNNKTTQDKWMDNCKNWMIGNGWIK